MGCGQRQEQGRPKIAPGTAGRAFQGVEGAGPITWLLRPGEQERSPLAMGRCIVRARAEARLEQGAGPAAPFAELAQPAALRDRRIRIRCGGRVRPRDPPELPVDRLAEQVVERTPLAVLADA